MPTITALLKAEGIEISPELEAKLPTLFEASDEARGLVATKDALLTWKQENADKVAGYDVIQEERNTSLEETKALALKNKDLEGYLAAEKEQVAIKDATIQTRNEQALKGTLSAAQSEIASLFEVNENGMAHAQNMVKTTIDDAGNVVKSYQLGAQSFDSFDELKQGAAKTPWLASQMKGPESKGPQSKGSGGGGELDVNVNKAADEAKANKDPIGHLNAHFKEALKL